MAVPTSFTDLSTTASANPPDGSTEGPRTWDDHQRQSYSFHRQNYNSIQTINTTLTLKASLSGATFTGPVVVPAGATGSQVPRKSEVDSAISSAVSGINLSAYALKAGNTYTGAHDFTGATVTLANGTVTSAYLNDNVVNGLTQQTPVAADYLLGSDTSGSNTKCKFLIQDLMDAIVFPGMVLDWPGNTAPPGWAACPNVQTIVNIADDPSYARINASIGNVYGGDGVSTIGLPYVAANQPTIAASGGNSGSSSPGQMPAHNHNVPVGTHGISPGPGSGLSNLGGTSVPTDTTGSGSNNMPAGMRMLKVYRK